MDLDDYRMIALIIGGIMLIAGIFWAVILSVDK
jgi:hypothetical protein